MSSKVLIAVLLLAVAVIGSEVGFMLLRAAFFFSCGFLFSAFPSGFEFARTKIFFLSSFHPFRFETLSTMLLRNVESNVVMRACSISSC